MIVVSGGMVASFALPATAATPTTQVKPKAAVTTGVVAIAAPAAAPAPMVPPAFGNIGFTGIDKPKPVVRRPVARTSRPATSRTTSSTSRAATRVALPTIVPAPRSAGVIGIAASLAGIYYVYGGTTTAGFDCSGYTSYVFRQIGISLPRTAEQQRQFATPVSNPQAGDLVFFGSPAHHVGIYAGNGKMWDSPHSGMAVSLRAIYSGVTYGRV